MRRFLELLVLTEVFVSAQLSMHSIREALEREYGNGDYVDPEGPLNIMRGHACVNNGMIAKQRKYASPMRLSYSCTGDGDEENFTYTRNAHEDEVRRLPADGKAMEYLCEHYRILKSMFTVENDVVVADGTPQAPFSHLFRKEHSQCVKLLAALLVLAGGGDIRFDPGSDGDTDDDKRKPSLYIYDAATPSLWEVFELEPADSATLAVVKFFAKYGGRRAKQLAGYGLHYTDSPSFLIQAYICELSTMHDIIPILAVARRIVAYLPVGRPSAQPRPRFFTNDTEYVQAYTARYDALMYVDEAFSGVRDIVLKRWHGLEHDYYGNCDDPKNIEPALLKLEYCLTSNPAINYLNAFGPSISGWRYKLCVGQAEAAASETTADCGGGSVSAAPAIDHKNVLVMLARALHEPEEELRSLQQLLNEALDNGGSPLHCQQISDRAAKLFGQFHAAPANAHFDICTAPDGTRHGSLRLTLRAICYRATHHYVLRLVLKPAHLELVFESQQATLHGDWQTLLRSVLEEADIPRNPALSPSRHEHLNELNDFPLRALIRERIGQILEPAAYRAVPGMYIAQVSAAKSWLAGHIALSRWMAHQPMHSLDEAVGGVTQLLPVLMNCLALSTDSNDRTQCALTADSPVVAVLDNLLGTIAVVNRESRPFIVGGLGRYVKERTDLFPSIFSVAGGPPCVAQEQGESAYDHFLHFMACYDISEMLLRQAERHARGKIENAGSVRGPWDSDVCAALARCFKLQCESNNSGLGCDAPGRCCYRNAICALLAADPVECHTTLRSICGRWKDTFKVFEAYVLLRRAFPKLPKLLSISPELVADVFPNENEPTAEQIQSLLRIFAALALTYHDYLGLCSVFHKYRALLSQESASEVVELLKKRPNAYSYMPRAISTRLYSTVDSVRTPSFYLALTELLFDCLENGFDIETLPKRVKDLPQTSALAFRGE
ncbi:hypothetical protein PAPHI01_0148 [Pancytospora philotis]|nr:hypothetical protein PAPHI01_0148 [Pancytospora philotis]